MNTKDKYIQKLEEYQKLLGDELDEVVVMMSIHGWKSSRVEQGIKLRAELSSLKAEMEKEEKSKYAIEIQHDKVENVTISGGTIIGED